MVSKILTSIIVLAKNEEGGIAKILTVVKKYSDEVLLIDGRSTDKTRKIAQSLGFRVFLDHGLGKGDGMKTGIKKARGKIVVFFDADGSHEAKDIPAMVKLLQNNQADFVTASRRTGGSFDAELTPTGIIRSLGADLLTMIVNHRFHAHLTDILYSFRAIKKDVFENLDLNSDGFEIEQEMVVKCLQKGYKLAEIPSREKARGWGKSKLQTITGIKFLLALVSELYS